MKVGIQARLKNGILWEAAKKMGSAAALARHLNVTSSEIGSWINFKDVPPPRRGKQGKHHPKWDEIESKLFVLTGCTLDEIFPAELCGEAFLKREKRIEGFRELPVEMLAAAGAVPQLLPAPDEILYREELGTEEGIAEVVDEVLATLTPREEKVIKMRFGLGDNPEHTLEETCQHFGVSRERIRQIEAKALRKLRHPARTRKLKAMHRGGGEVLGSYYVEPHKGVLGPEFQTQPWAHEHDWLPVWSSHPLANVGEFLVVYCVECRARSVALTDEGGTLHTVDDVYYGPHSHRWLYNPWHPAYDENEECKPVACICGAEAEWSKGLIQYVREDRPWLRQIKEAREKRLARTNCGWEITKDAQI